MNKKKSHKTLWIYVLTILCVLLVLWALQSIQNIPAAQHDAVEGMYSAVVFFVIFTIFIVQPLRFLWVKFCGISEKYAALLSEKFLEHAFERQTDAGKVTERLSLLYVAGLLILYIPGLFALHLLQNITWFLAVFTAAPFIFVFCARYLVESWKFTEENMPQMVVFLKARQKKADALAEQVSRNRAGKRIAQAFRAVSAVQNLYYLTAAVYLLEIIDYVGMKNGLQIPVLVISCIQAIFILRWLVLDTFEKPKETTSSSR